MQKILAAKKLNENSLYFFYYDLDVKKGDNVVVQFEDFLTIACVVRTDEKNIKHEEDLGKVVRIATANDLDKYQKLNDKAKKELPIFKKKSLELGLMMKFVNAEYSLDNSKILIVFSSEDRVDFRQLLKELASMLKIRIELKQIGQRDEVKMVGGVGPCGQQCCCARFLKEFEHVTVKMAKIQSLSLAPTKINGVCGRLMCCLGYESGVYEEQIAKMPKINSEVISPNGKGTVVYNDLLRERVSVKRQAEGDTIIVEEFELGDLKGYEKYKKKIEEEPEKKQAKPEKKDKKFEPRKEVNTQREDDRNKNNEAVQKQDEPFEMMLGGNEKKESQPNNDGVSKKNHHRRFFHKNKKK